MAHALCCFNLQETNASDSAVLSLMYDIFQSNESEYSWFGDFDSVNFSLDSTHLAGMFETESPRPYYGDQLKSFRFRYILVHGYLGVIVCLFGILANVLNIIVLTRKEMISSTNAVLTGLAAADMLVMVSYLPHCIHNYVYFHQPVEMKFSYGWAVFTLFHAHFTVVCHTISIWLTVTLAIWRFVSVSFPAASKTWCNMSRAKCAIFCTYVNCAVFCLPVYLTFTINRRERGDKILYQVDFSEIAQRNGLMLEKINFWLFSVLTKLIPCVALTGLSLGLIRVLYEANLRKQRLKNRIENDKARDRTTRMLLAVLLLFLITEFPSGILALLSGILGKEFFRNVYLNFAEVIDLLALLNSAINFILYCSMSRQFRDTFSSLFTPNIFARCMSLATERTTAHTACV